MRVVRAETLGFCCGVRCIARLRCAVALVEEAASADEVDGHALVGLASIGLTAGASTPDAVLDEVLRRLRQLGR